MITVSGLTKRYGNKVAVNNISFTINQGDIVGLLGPNGAGKSTTMNMLTGYISSHAGKIVINGHDLLEEPSKAKENFGYLPEIPPLYHDMTVREYLNFVYNLKGCAKKENIKKKKEHIAEVCDVVKITGVYNRLIKNLSKGYKQRVGLAQALIGDPPILILDEPTAGLDPKEIVEIRNLIKRLGTRRTIILSSHILSEVQAVCERIIIMNEGFIVMDALADDLTMRMGANSRYGVRLAAPEDADVIGVLGALPGVAKIEYVGSFEKGTIDFIIEAEKKVDIRRLLFDECAKRNWYILMITPLGMSLEDIFLQLVQQNDEQRALAGKKDEKAEEKASENKEENNEEKEEKNDDSDN
ncbi:MAG: ATP-binding cassette domain-containing protein [Clostridia bacterium]|nr:ATP-binding cassette domain-containing protein [Clostridia bacterium]